MTVARLPEGACDTQAHAFGEDVEDLLVPDWGPQLAAIGLDAYRARMDAIGIRRCVVLQHGAYGTDSTVLVRWLRAIGERSRGVIHLDRDASPADLRGLDDMGVRGIRVGNRSPHLVPLRELDRVASLAAGLGWHLDLLVEPDELVAIALRLDALPVPVVIGHLGRIRAAEGVAGPAFQSLLRLAGEGVAWIKLSAIEFLSDDAHFRDLDPMIEALKQTGCERLLWGTDWPHGTTLRRGEPMPSATNLVAAMERWFPGSEERQRLLVANPARFYGF